MGERSLRALLEDALDAEPPIGPVAQNALRAGRRLRRRRWAARVAGSVATGLQIGTTMHAGSGAADGVAFTPDGKTLVTTDIDGTIRQWSVATRRPVGPPLATAGHHEFGMAAVSPAGTILVTIQDSGPACLWNLKFASQPFCPK
jgi:hypothetical protein